MRAIDTTPNSPPPPSKKRCVRPAPPASTRTSKECSESSSSGSPSASSDASRGTQFSCCCSCFFCRDLSSSSASSASSASSPSSSSSASSPASTSSASLPSSSSSASFSLSAASSSGASIHSAAKDDDQDSSYSAALPSVPAHCNDSSGVHGGPPLGEAPAASLFPQSVSVPEAGAPSCACSPVASNTRSSGNLPWPAPVIVTNWEAVILCQSASSSDSSVRVAAQADDQDSSYSSALPSVPAHGTESRGVHGGPPLEEAPAASTLPQSVSVPAAGALSRACSPVASPTGSSGNLPWPAPFIVTNWEPVHSGQAYAGGGEVGKYAAIRAGAVEQEDAEGSELGEFKFNGDKDGYDGDSEGDDERGGSGDIMDDMDVEDAGEEEAGKEEGDVYSKAEGEEGSGNGVVEEEAKEVDDLVAQAEDDAISSESTRSESSANDSTEWESTDEDAKDEDYDPKASSDPPTEDDYGMAISFNTDNNDYEEQMDVLT